jgi:hypothetical protein
MGRPFCRSGRSSLSRCPCDHRTLARELETADIASAKRAEEGQLRSIVYGYVEAVVVHISKLLIAFTAVSIGLSPSILGLTLRKHTVPNRLVR